MSHLFLVGRPFLQKVRSCERHLEVPCALTWSKVGAKSLCDRWQAAGRKRNKSSELLSSRNKSFQTDSLRLQASLIGQIRTISVKRFVRFGQLSRDQNLCGVGVQLGTVQCI